VLFAIFRCSAPTLPLIAAGSGVPASRSPFRAFMNTGPHGSQGLHSIVLRRWKIMLLMVESESATRSSSKGFGITYLRCTHVHVKNHKAARQDGSVKTQANTRATGSTKDVGRTLDGRDGLWFTTSPGISSHPEEFNPNPVLTLTFFLVGLVTGLRRQL